MYKSFVSLGRYIPKYFILFVAMVNGIVSLISLSVFSLLEKLRCGNILFCPVENILTFLLDRSKLKVTFSLNRRKNQPCNFLILFYLSCFKGCTQAPFLSSFLN